MYDSHSVAAFLGASLGIASFIPYYRDVFNGSTKPHLFTWVIWTVLTGVTALIQITTGAGVGAYVAAVESVCCLSVAILAVRRGERDITTSDWICLVLGLFAIALWLVVHQPLLAVILVVTADLLGFIPTFRKSFHKPQEETALQFALSASHWITSLFALQSLAFIEWLYPAAIAAMDSALVVMLLIRRRQLAQKYE